MRILSCWFAIIFAGPAWVSAQVTVPMSQYDYERTGANLQEWILNPSNVDPTRFGRRLNVMFVATMGNTVYAFDADDPAQSAPLWSRNLGTPAPALDIYNGTPKYNSPQLLSFPFAGPEGTLTNVKAHSNAQGC